MASRTMLKRKYREGVAWHFLRRMKWLPTERSKDAVGETADPSQIGALLGSMKFTLYGMPPILGLVV